MKNQITEIVNLLESLRDNHRVIRDNMYTLNETVASLFTEARQKKMHLRFTYSRPIEYFDSYQIVIDEFGISITCDGWRDFEAVPIHGAPIAVIHEVLRQLPQILSEFVQYLKAKDTHYSRVAEATKALTKAITASPLNTEDQLDEDSLFYHDQRIFGPEEDEQHM